MSDLLLKAGGVNYLYFDGAGDSVNFGSDAAVDDLPDGNDLTVEVWFRAALDVSNGALLTKTSSSTEGWLLILANTHPRATINFADDNASGQDNDEDLNDGQLHHLAFTFDHSTLTVRMWLDGALLKTNSGSGAYEADAALNLRMGTYSNGTTVPFTGHIGGWARISTTLRYSDTFTPDPVDDPPDVDADTLCQWNFAEGSGDTLADECGVADGTIVNAKWVVL